MSRPIGPNGGEITRAPLLEVLDIVSDDGNPSVLSLFVNRILGLGEIWISEGAKRYGGYARHPFSNISNCGTAFGAETKARAVSAISLMSPNTELARHFNAFVRPPGLSGERATRALLTVKAMTYGNADRVAIASRLQLPTSTGCDTISHDDRF